MASCIRKWAWTRVSEEESSATRCCIVDCRLMTALRYCLASWRVLLNRGAVWSEGEISSHFEMMARAVSMFSSISESEKVLVGGKEGGNGNGDVLKKNKFLSPIFGISI
ncbi:hypothetical protein JHK87_037948 [Glycine soja]|nr:hypothetical protein JHK87_037948 [Glycine soja]